MMRYLFALVLTSLGVLICLGLDLNFQNTDLIQNNAQNDNRCFMKMSAESEITPEAVAYLKRQDFGFDEELSLTEAVRIFNEEQKCFPQMKEPLTEEEVLASILAGADYGNRNVFDHHRDSLLKIVLHKRIPKGALFVFEGDSYSNGPFIEGDIFIKGQRVYLFLGLDKKSRYEMSSNSQIHLVRKRFVSSQNIKIDRTR